MKACICRTIVPALAVVFVVAAVQTAGAQEATDENQAKVVVLKTIGDAGEGEPCTMVTTTVLTDEEGQAGGDDQQPCVATVVLKTDEDDDAKITVHALRAGNAHAVHTGGEGGPCALASAQPADPSRGWLGVSLSEVSPALAAQLDLDDGAVMISNVVKESPAAAAGVQRYDVITAINGQSVGDSIPATAERIGELGSGTSAQFTVLRGGEEMSVEVTLGSRPDPAEMVWDFDWDVGPSISDKFRSRARVMMRGPDGKFHIKHLGDLKNLANLPESILQFIPEVDDVTTHLWIDKGDQGAHTHITTRIEEDGQILEIEKKDDMITVRRTTTDEQGNTTTTENSYDSVEELEEADPEAYEIFSRIQGPHVIDLDLDLSGLSALGQLGHLGHLSQLGDLSDLKDAGIDLEELLGDQAEWRAELEKSMQAAQKAFEEAMKNVDRDAHFDWALKFRPFLGPEGRFWASHAGEATQTFTVTPEGRIEVKLRKGDSEVVMVYEDEADLRARNPEMYEKYTEVTSAPVDE